MWDMQKIIVKCEKCGKVIAEPKELIRIQKIMGATIDNIRYQWHLKVNN